MHDSVEFMKISATGNDFILIDNRDGRFDAQHESDFFRQICRRRRSVGADGVILLQKSERADFHYIHVNSDGSIAEMCGNGSRAVVFFAIQRGIGAERLSFEINGHLYHATAEGSTITTEFIPPGEYRLDVPIVDEPGLESGGYIDTGVPHFVIFVEDVNKVDVAGLGGKYRHHPFFPRGTNVDFVQTVKGLFSEAAPHSFGSTDEARQKGKARLYVRTFERGVEEETLACGTGAVASSIIAHLRKGIHSPVTLTFPGGDLIVAFDANFSHITLTGEVTPVYTGKLEVGPSAFQ